MERSILDITLDLQRPSLPGAVTVNRGDTHRTLRFYLSDGARPYPVNDLQAVLTAVKPDGSCLFNHCTVADDRILYDLTPQTTACPGPVECQLRLYGKEGELLNTAAFTISVEDTVYGGDEVITSAGEVSALTKLMTEADEKLQQMEAVLKNEVNHAVLDDSRVGSNTWSSKNLVDRLCPGFSVTGGVVLCKPAEDYPLEVISTLEDRGEPWQTITLHRSGKNLVPGGDQVQIGSTTGYKTLTLERPLPPGNYVISLVSYTQTPASTNGYAPVIVTKYQDGTEGPSMYCQYHSDYAVAVTFTKPVSRIQFWSNTYSSSTSKGVAATLYGVQIEPGKTRTDYESYQPEQLLTATVDGVLSGSYNWSTGVLTDEAGNKLTLIPQLITGREKTNAFYSDCGTTTVTGKLDIRPLLTKLSEV